MGPKQRPTSCSLEAHMLRKCQYGRRCQCSFWGCIDSYLEGPAAHQPATDATEYECSFTLEAIEFLGEDFLLSMGSVEKELSEAIEPFDANPPSPTSSIGQEAFDQGSLKADAPCTGYRPRGGDRRSTTCHGPPSGWEDPLYGGGGKSGSRTTQRVRAEKLRAQDPLQRAQSVAAVAAEPQRAPTGPRQGEGAPPAGPRAEARPPTATSTKPRRERRRRGDSPSISGLRPLTATVDSGQEVTQTQVISEPQEVISTITSGAPPSALEPSPKGPIAILAATRAEYEQCEREREAFGNRQNITYVVLDINGSDSVLLEGQRGSRSSAKASITYLSDSAPKRAGLHSSMKDDELVATTKLKMVNFRITISTEFADETLFHVASAEPQTTPALVLGDDLAERALRARGAIAYEAEVARIAPTTEANADSFGKADAIKRHVRSAPANLITARDLTTWATERGFQNVTGAARAGARAWTLYGGTPAGAVATAHASASGAIVSRAFSKNGASAKAARQDAPMGAAAAAAAVPEDTDAAWARMAGTAPHEAELAAKHAKGENGKPAQALAALAPSKSTPKTGDFKPGGLLQANIRLAAQAQALKKLFKATEEDADKIGTTGTPAYSLAARLVAKATNCDIHAWSRTPGVEKRALYGREQGAKPRLKEIWPKLDDLNNKWLQPKPEHTETVEYRQTFEGWPRLDPEAMSTLGPPAPSSAAAATRAPKRRPAAALSQGARSTLGLDTGAPDDAEATAARVKGCGQWTPPAPPPHLSRSQASAWRHHKATVHWRECQGAPPPKLKDQPAAISRSAIQAPGPGPPSARPAAPSHSKPTWTEDWKAALPASVQPSVRSPDENTVSSHVPKSGGIQHRFTCSMRTKTTNLIQFRNDPCRARPATMTRLTTPTAMREEEAAIKVHEAERKSGKRFLKTHGERRKELYKERHSDPAQREIKRKNDRIRRERHHSDPVIRQRVARQKHASRLRREAAEAKKRPAAACRRRPPAVDPLYGGGDKTGETELQVATLHVTSLRADRLEEMLVFPALLPRCLTGDLNWHPSYENALPEHAFLRPATKPTTVAETSPTRAMGTSMELKLKDVSFLPLIPHHGLVVFPTKIASPNVQVTSTRRTTRFKLDSGTILLPSDVEELQSEINAPPPVCEAAAPLPERWSRWHARAEGTLTAAAERGWPLRDGAAERGKGPLPTSRKVATTPAARPSEPMELIRLKRLGRRMAHQLRDHACELLSGPILDQHVDNALRGRLTAGPRGRPTHAEAHAQVSKAVSAIQRDLMKERRTEWWRLFQHYYPETWRAATAEVHGPSECPSFNATDMAEEWKKVRDWCPSCANFRAAVRKANGSAGYDGWHSSELKLISEHFEFLLFDLYMMWRDTCEALLVERPSLELQHLIFAWRVVGVPKKDPTQSRPIGVGSVLLQAWLTACEPSLPTPQDADFACKAGSTVVHACCLWLHACQHGQCDGLPWDINGTKFLFMDDRWKRGDKQQIEHIGILAVPDDPYAKITPAAGWDKLRKCLAAIRRLPGGSESQATAVRAYAKCTWWCRGRIKASNIDLHPVYSAVLVAIDRIAYWEIQWSDFLEVNFMALFEAIGFEFLQYDPGRGVQFRRPVDEPDALVRRLRGRRHICWSDEKKVPHLIRQVCRARALANTRAERNDAEGVDQIDLEASSAKVWAIFRGSLTLED
ncbi:unnamed protein product [Prorocentrum cordatum]|uniref:Uncharacterized protein n=1 Tax=Prorocentrum cordatum TaxID=2364126 RepID=A0ABN9VJD6_9DINO|nr:unnamed protein product [Polarella glacialis]